MIPTATSPSPAYTCTPGVIPTIATIRTYNDYIKAISTVTQFFNTGTIPWNDTSTCAIPSMPTVYDFSTDVFNSLDIITCYLDNFAQATNTAVTNVSNTASTALTKANQAQSRYVTASINSSITTAVNYLVTPYTIVGGAFREYVVTFTFPNAIIKNTNIIAGQTSLPCVDAKWRVQVIPSGIVANAGSQDYQVSTYTGLQVGTNYKEGLDVYTKIVRQAGGLYGASLGAHSPWHSALFVQSPGGTAITTQPVQVIAKIWVLDFDIANGIIQSPEHVTSVIAECDHLVHYAN